MTDLQLNSTSTAPWIASSTISNNSISPYRNDSTTTTGYENLTSTTPDFFGNVSSIIENLTTTLAPIPELSVDLMPLWIEIAVLAIGTVLSTVLYVAFFKKILNEDEAAGGPTAIHKMHLAEYDKQQAEFLTEGGGANRLRVEGEPKPEIQKKNNILVDPQLLDQNVRDDGTEVENLMKKERLTKEEAIQRIAERKADKELEKAAKQAESAGTKAISGTNDPGTSATSAGGDSPTSPRDIAPIPELAVDLTPLWIEIAVLAIGTKLSTVLYVAFFKKILNEDEAAGGPTAIGKMHLADYDKQQAEFLA
ncbi:hypothetical protein L596_008405 [Steinernema carpocapsae]|uniref:Uncharacterized protein n=1 Tax=Steinernema carpocapsae TaxID=34508 RepID=A0A4U5PDG5_STECR|nr:hypothetical protein L596_008405 [Steinernema carpocapsae]